VEHETDDGYEGERDQAAWVAAANARLRSGVVTVETSVGPCVVDEVVVFDGEPWLRVRAASASPGFYCRGSRQASLAEVRRIARHGATTKLA
jgi:hypothetical protein